LARPLFEKTVLRGLEAVESNGEARGSGQVESWLAAARQGSAEALGKVLESCRPYLLKVANEYLAADLQAKLGASDLVQDACLEAHRDFGRFTGLTEAEMLAWLRRILLQNLKNVTRHYQRDKRQVGCEIGLADVHPKELTVPASSRDQSPSSQARARERDEALAQALAQLPEDQREIIRLRNYERLSFPAAGERMGRSPDAARKLWARAIGHLQRLLEPPDEP
jgi:RNA polymerase sigma-70 factor (ECF subfamily)